MTNANLIPKSGNKQHFDIRKTMNKYDIGSVPGSGGFCSISLVLQRIQDEVWEGLLQESRVLEIKVLLVSCIANFQLEDSQTLDGHETLVTVVVRSIQSASLKFFCANCELLLFTHLDSPSHPSHNLVETLVSIMNSRVSYKTQIFWHDFLLLLFLLYKLKHVNL